jgi:hypothetical protein
MLKFVAMADREHKKYQEGGSYNWLTGTYTSGTNPVTGMPNTFQTGVSGASGLGAVVGGFADLIGSQDRINDQKKARKKAKDRIKNFYSDATSGMYDFSLDTGYGDIYEMSKTKTSRDPFTRAFGATMNTLDQSGGRTLLAGLNPAMQNLAMGETQLGLTDLQREMSGLQQLTQARAGITQQNEAFQRQLGLRRLEQDELAQATAEQNIENLRQARRDAFGNIATGALETGLSFINPIGENGMKVPNYSQGGKNAGLAKLQKDHPEVYEKITGQKAEHGMRYQMGGGMPAGPNAGVLAQIMGGGAPGGGMPPVQGPLPGPASHETNPIDMVDKNGEKVGEAMGGEFIINNDQADTMMAEYKPLKEKIDAGEKPTEDEWMELYEAVHSVLGQPQFQDNMA